MSGDYSGKRETESLPGRGNSILKRALAKNENIE